MIIEIHRTELEALILERMERGAYESVEDVLMQALLPSPPVNGEPFPDNNPPLARVSPPGNAPLVTAKV